VVLWKTVIYCGGEVVGLGKFIEEIGFYLGCVELGFDIFGDFKIKRNKLSAIQPFFGVIGKCLFSGM